MIVWLTVCSLNKPIFLSIWIVFFLLGIQAFFKPILLIPPESILHCAPGAGWGLSLVMSLMATAGGLGWNWRRIAILLQSESPQWGYCRIFHTLRHGRWTASTVREPQSGPKVQDSVSLKGRWGWGCSLCCNSKTCKSKICSDYQHG